MRKTKISESDRAVPPQNILANLRRHFMEWGGSGEKIFYFANSRIPAWLTFPAYHKQR
jgi:hypothetical protein